MEVNSQEFLLIICPPAGFLGEGRSFLPERIASNFLFVDTVSLHSICALLRGPQGADGSSLIQSSLALA